MAVCGVSHCVCGSFVCDVGDCISMVTRSCREGPSSAFNCIDRTSPSSMKDHSDGVVFKTRSSLLGVMRRLVDP